MDYLWPGPKVARILNLLVGTDKFILQVNIYISQDYVSTSLSRVILVLGVLEYRV